MVTVLGIADRELLAAQRNPVLEAQWRAAPATQILASFKCVSKSAPCDQMNIVLIQDNFLYHPVEFLLMWDPIFVGAFGAAKASVWSVQTAIQSSIRAVCLNFGIPIGDVKMCLWIHGHASEMKVGIGLHIYSKLSVYNKAVILIFVCLYLVTCFCQSAPRIVPEAEVAAGRLRGTSCCTICLA
mmetsp:Transcript_41920/g.72886  ORF Transcript_41920/g.72886 Transcript_41920/m.72886 type:complete len:184 (+) Transcript_41920:1972-2523(+)